MVAQLGARRHYAVPRAFAAVEMLGDLVTDLCADAAPLTWLRTLTPASLRPKPLRRLLDRAAPDIPRSKIHNLTSFAIDPRFRRREGETQTEHWARRNAGFGRAVVARGFGNADAVYAFNGAALEIFEAAKRRGLFCILDQTAAPWRYNADLLRQEMNQWPGWEEQAAEIDETGQLSEREEREWRLADVIVCGSKFASDALGAIGGPVHKCVVVPYSGHIASAAHPRKMSQASVAEGAKLRVLTLGSLQLRKGPQYLRETARQLSADVEFRWVGKSLLSADANAQMREHVELVDQVPRPEIWDQLAWADVFVLPTLSEGSANVVYEAMAAGLPIVTTPNAGSAIRHGVTGVLVEPRNSAALAEAIRQLKADAAERSRLGKASRSALNTTSLRVYGEMLARHALNSPGRAIAS